MLSHFLSSLSIRSIKRDIYLYHTRLENLSVKNRRKGGAGCGTALDGGSDSMGYLDSISVIRGIGGEGKS